MNPDLIRRTADLVAGFEGLYLEAYLCPAGIWTIGYGTTRYPNGKAVRPGDKISEAQARNYLELEITECLEQVEQAVLVPLTDNQRVALASLIYNVGYGAFLKSKMLAKIKAGDFAGAANEFDDWVNAGGQKLEGLVRRRAAEKALFLKDQTQSQFNFHDFFKYYNHRNPKHQNAVLELAKHLPPAQLSDQANWVRIYRSPWQPPQPKFTEIDWGNGASRVSEFFTVNEVIQGDRRRIPTEARIKKNILRLAAELDKLRREWGGPIGVTSWYRPKEINAAVGGADGSEHIQGHAADIYPLDGRNKEFENWLDGIWQGGLGYGVASGRGFTHVDLGPRARWRY